MTMSEERMALILAAPYARVIRPAEEGGFDCEVLEFPGCYATGDDAAEATENLEEAMSLWVEAAIEQGQDIPEPISADDYSGRFTLRLPPSLHQRADLMARVEGVSLNRFFSAAVAQYVGGAPARKTASLLSYEDIAVSLRETAASSPPGAALMWTNPMFDYLRWLEEQPEERSPWRAVGEQESSARLS